MTTRLQIQLMAPEVMDLMKALSMILADKLKVVDQMTVMSMIQAETQIAMA